jgi:hypothetical protein
VLYFWCSSSWNTLYVCKNINKGEVTILINNLMYIWTLSLCNLCNIGLRVRIMVFNVTFNNISVISWRSVLLLMEETGVSRENHRHVVASHWQIITSSSQLVMRSWIQPYDFSGDRMNPVSSKEVHWVTLIIKLRFHKYLMGNVKYIKLFSIRNSIVCHIYIEDGVKHHIILLLFW